MKRVNVAGWLFVVLLTLLVEAAVRGFGWDHTLSPPSSTLRALVEELRSGALSGELATTLERVVVGLVIGAAIGVGLGLAIGSSRLLRDASSVTLEFLRPIPAISLIPVALVFFGLGASMYRFVVAYAVVWPIFLNTLYGVRGVDRTLHDVARTSGVGRLGRLVRVTLPAALPSIATGLRLGAAVALVVTVTTEWVYGTDGVGWYMERQQFARNLDELYAAVALTALLGYLANVTLRAVERLVVFWTGEERSAL